MPATRTIIRNHFWSAIAALSVFVNLTAADELPKRPNFVFIYADDLRWDCLGAVQREQGKKARFPWLQTPRLDKLAEESLRFSESFVVNSLCSPARACVLTGQYNHANKIVGNDRPLPKETVTFAIRLQEAGYRTAYCGKWHMGRQRDRPGFDFVASFLGQGRYFDCPFFVDGRETPNSGWIDDVSTDYAISFLEKQPIDQPFFLFLGFKSPHEPRGGKNLPAWAQDLYANEHSRPTPNIGAQATFRLGVQNSANDAKQRAERDEGVRSYMRHVTAIDRCVGRLLDAVSRTGHTERTIIIVSSDNGYYLGEHGLSDKRSAYEESMRVPLLIRLPDNNAQRGVVNKHSMVLNIDYAPTILDLAGAKPLPKPDGRSLRPLLNGESPANWRESFRYEYFKELEYASPDVVAFRTTTHKLITYPGHDDWTEVFDLVADPYETQNLVQDSDLLEELRVLLGRSEPVASRDWRLTLILVNSAVLALLLWLGSRQRVLRRNSPNQTQYLDSSSTYTCDKSALFESQEL